MFFLALVAISIKSKIAPEKKLIVVGWEETRVIVRYPNNALTQWKVSPLC